MITTSLLSAFALFSYMVHAKAWFPWNPNDQLATVKCLTDAQAADIASRYVSRYDTGAVKTLADLTGIVTTDFTSYDETATGGYSNQPATQGIDEFFASLNASGPSSFTNAVQYPIFVLHDCNTISYRWQFEAYSTGYNSTVPAGKFLKFKGTDIISVDLEKLLVYNATSSGDWINVARELGQIGDFFP